jgi:excisionase family DNA binding protein
MTPVEAARELGVSAASVRRWLASGRLEGIRVGGRLRIGHEALEDVVAPAARATPNEGDHAA